MRTFYTYIWYRNDWTPYYVGKGSGNRAFERHKRLGRGPKDKNKIDIQYWDTEEEAFEAEKDWIRFFGRKDNGTGMLRNLTDGGENPPKSKKGQYQPPRSLSTRILIGIRSQEAWSKNHEPRQLGRPCPENVKAIVGSRYRGKKLSPEHVEKMRQAAIRRQQTEEGKLNSSRAGKLGAAARWGK